MIRKAFKFAASVLFLSASSLFIAGFAALAFGSFLLTWPFIHGSPTRRRVASGVNLVSSVMQFISTMPNPRHVVEMLKVAQQAAGALSEDNPGNGVTNV